MSSGCGDVLSLADLQTAKKHQIFEAEVITGKSGGVSGGADIDYATNQVTGQTQKTMPAILRDIGFEPASFDFTAGGTLGLSDRHKSVLWSLASGGDGQWYYWEGALPKVIPASSTPATTGGVAEGAWRPVGDITLREELATSGAGKGANLVHDNTRNSSVQSVLDASAAGYNVNDAALSTANLAGKTLYRIFKPLSVTDADNQGAVVPAGMTVYNLQRNQNAISTAKIQSAFRIGGDDVTISGVKGVGLAEPDNSATSEFITTRMAWSASQVISNLRIENVNARNFTAGVGLYGVDGAHVLNSNFGGMQYSPTSLNSAGGYGIVIGDGKNIEVSGNTFIATASDRHAVYVSVNQGYTPPATGWKNVRIINNYYDWTGTESANDDSKVPFNVRAGSGLFISGNRGIGGTRCVGLHNSDGPISNVVISNNYVTGIKPQAGLSGCFISSLSALANGYQISNLDIVNNTFQVLRDPTTTGLDQAARLIKVNNLRIVNNKHTIDTGVGYLIQDCNNVFIDDIVEVVTDPTTADAVGARTLDFEGSCSNITIGNIRTNRLTRSDGKTNLIYGLPNCTDVTCNFSRYIEFTVTNGVVSQVDDAYDIISSGGVTFGASSITIAFRAHVTQASTASCAPYSRTANNTMLTKAIVGDKSITIALTNANTGAVQPTSNYTARIGVTFFS